MNTKSARLCFVGNMLGRNPGYITSQGQIVADLLAGDGYKVVSASSKLSRPLRLADIIKIILENRKQIDVLILEVYSGLSMVFADAASLLCKLFNIPLVSVLHGGNLPVFIRRYPRWTMRVLRRADILTAPSPFLAKELAKFNFQVRVVPNVLELDAYPFKKRRQISPKLIWMRSFHSIYNPHLTIKVLSSLLEKKPETTLVMAGVDKGLENEIKEMADGLGLKEAVRFPGFLDMKAKIKEFSDADIYLNTNRIDNMPVSVIEACAMGLPVVATNVGGLSHIISDGENGVLVADDNVEEMAKAVIELLDNSELTKKLSRNGRALAEKSSWSSVRLQWEDIFAEALNKKT